MYARVREEKYVVKSGKREDCFCLSWILIIFAAASGISKIIV